MKTIIAAATLTLAALASLASAKGFTAREALHIYDISAKGLEPLASAD